MDEPTVASTLRLDGSAAADMFRFDDGDGWMEHLRSAGAVSGLGRIGAFEIIEEVGRGGQGIVYKARQPHTHRLIALKRLVAGAFASEMARRRFEREVEAVTALNHPNIVTVYGMEIVDGLPLLAMEWVQGSPISKWAQQPDGRPRPAREILEMFLLVCDAMRHAHARGVIHRDLKPGNILVMEGAEGTGIEDAPRRGGPQSLNRSIPQSVSAQPKILDFGLAKRVDPDHRAEEFTLADEFVGTPAYAAPEQVRLDNQAIDVRTDVYSLGVMLFQMLTGQMPYEITRNLAVLIDTIQRVEPHRPSSLDPRLGREIDAIVLKALAKEQPQRYQTVDALAEDVRRYLAGEPILAHPPTATYYLRKLLRRHRVPAAIASVAFLALLSVGTYAVTQLVFKLQQEDKTYANSQALRAQSRVLAETLVAVDRELRRGEPVSVVSELESAHERMATGFVGQSEAPRLIEGELAAVYAQLGALARAEKGYREALDELRERSQADSAEFADYANGLAIVLYRNNQLQEAESLLREAQRIRAAVNGPRDVSVAMTLNDLVVLLLTQRRVEEARPLIVQALEMQRHADRPYARNTGILHLNHARVLLHLNDFSAAERELESSLAQFRTLPNHEFDDYAQALSLVASIAAERGQLDPARAALEEAVRIWRACLGEWHPRVADGLLDLSAVLEAQGKLDDAMQRCWEAVSVSENTLGDAHPQSRTARTRLDTLRRLRDGGAPASASTATMPAE